MDPNNKTLWNALKACEAAFAADKKTRFAAAEIERQVEAERLKRQEEIKKEIQEDRERRKKEEQEFELLNGFLSDLTEKTEKSTPQVRRFLILNEFIYHFPLQ